MATAKLNFTHTHSHHHFKAEAEPLHHAHKAAKLVFATSFFSCYKQEHIDKQIGIKYALIYTYNVVVITNKALYRGVVWIVEHVAFLILIPYNATIGWALKKTIYPYNPISGEHHFVFVPRRVEKFLGDWVFYPSSTFGMKKSITKLSNDTSINVAVEEAFEKIRDRNKELLNPKGETLFDYRVTTVRSSKMNAFCVPGGGMVVFSQIVQVLHGGIGQIKESTITLADGSKVKVDLSGVTLQDALGALMGHEMTHAASRHSMASMSARFIFSCVLKIVRLFLITSMIEKASSKKEEEKANKVDLSKMNKSSSKKNEEENKKANEVDFSMMERLVAWSEDKVGHIADLIRGRNCEYEADVTGTYFLHQADLNPLGALFLLEVLSQSKGRAASFFHRNLEFLYTHPWEENRKRAVFAAIAELDPERLKAKITKWEKGSSDAYDLSNSSPALQYCEDLHQMLKNPLINGRDSSRI